MKNIVWLIIAILFAQTGHADSTKSESWKVFESDFGYSFKYPACWGIRIDSPDERGHLRQIHNLAVEEKTCLTPPRDPEVNNGLGFQASLARHDKAAAAAKLEVVQREVSAELKNKNYLVSKTQKVDSDGTLVLYVESLSKLRKIIRWRAELVCPTRLISIGGASLKNPSEEVLKELAAGSLAIPEPYKTIFASVKCSKDKK